MDAKNEAYVRELIEIALLAEEKLKAAEADYEAASEARNRAAMKRRDTAIDLQGALRGDVIIYGNQLISVNSSSDGPRIAIRKIEEVAVVTPPESPPKPTHVAAVVTTIPAPSAITINAPATESKSQPKLVPPLTPLAGGKIPSQPKK